MENKILTCIVCPRGCQISIELDDEGKIFSVSGNSCKRGAVYAENELTHPVRTVTSTVRTVSGSVTPVKTAQPVPKELVFEVMKEIAKVEVKDDIGMGDIVICNVCGCGVDVVSTSQRKIR